MSQRVKLSSGISLEVDLDAPPSLSETRKLAICLHPWSWLGGQKDDPVLQSLIYQLHAENYHALRYNSRGVGRSTGWASFTGFSEAKDLEDLVSWATQQITNIKSLVFIGYSYGSLIASLHPIIPSIKTTHILISYPLGPRGWLTLFHAGTYNGKLQELVQNADSHVLVVFGGRDEFTSVEKYKEWRTSLEQVSSRERLRVVEVAEASHFWSGQSRKQLGKEVRRPLPDERPRGSVANLIGRFETQVKRQSSSSPASARSLSATSHMSGDSAKEEAKERHEWPPKPASPDVKAPITIPSSSFARSLALAQAVSAETTLGTPATQVQADVVEASTPTPRPHSTTSNSDKSKIVVATPAQQQFSIDVIPLTPMTSGTLTTAKPPTTAKPLPARLSTEATGKPSTMAHGRTPVKSSGPRPYTNPAVQPIKSQTTGPNNSSSFSRKPVAKPIAARSVATLVSTRPKTPSSSMQPRTPSSGLFAPTAASLARSRNAQQPSIPTSTKKATMSSAVAERLSKPTAASLSRTRTTTATGAKAAVSASSASRGTTASKLKTSTTLTRKTGAISTTKKTAAAAVGAAAAVAEPEPGSELPPAENGHQTGEHHVDKHSEDALDLEKQDHEQGNSVPGDSSQANAEPVVVANDEAVEGANNETDAASPDKLGPHDTSLEHSVKPEPAPVNGDHEANDVGPEANVGNKIEDMVNLHETLSVTKARPESIVTIPDEEWDFHETNERQNDQI